MCNFFSVVVTMVIVSQVHHISYKLLKRDMRKKCTYISSSVMISALFFFDFSNEYDEFSNEYS